MTVLYILGDGSKHDNIELRWSLRSLAKFATDVDRVIVAGNPPDWLSPEVERFDYHQHLDRTNRNIPDTVVAAITALDLHGEIVMAYDDAILSDRVTFAALGLMVRGWTLPEMVPGDCRNNYFKALVETRKFLMEHSLPALDFEQHAFKIIDADLIRVNMKIVREAIDKSYFGVTADCLFTNLMLTKPNHRPVVRREDSKLCNMTLHDISRDWCFSFSDKAFDDPTFLQLMNDFYGEPCKYEVP